MESIQWKHRTSELPRNEEWKNLLGRWWQLCFGIKDELLEFMAHKSIMRRLAMLWPHYMTILSFLQHYERASCYSHLWFSNKQTKNKQKTPTLQLRFRAGWRFSSYEQVKVVVKAWFADQEKIISLERDNVAGEKVKKCIKLYGDYITKYKSLVFIWLHFVDIL